MKSQTIIAAFLLITQLSFSRTSTPNKDTWVTNGTVYSLAADDNYVYLGGDFTTIGGVYQSCFALFTERILPVELISFNISVLVNTVRLNWQTATEVNNYGFEIEAHLQPHPKEGELKFRMAEKKGSWQKIGFVQGYGNSNSPKSYSYTDRQIHNSTVVHYRLKQIDFDGAFEFSNVVEIKLETPTEFKLEQNYPNPFNPITTIRYSIPNVETDRRSVFTTLKYMTY